MSAGRAAAYRSFAVAGSVLLFMAAGAGIAAYPVVSHRHFHFFAVSLLVAAIAVAVCHRRSRASGDIVQG